jgi:small-conductance mechanosensitive channel
MPHLGTVLLVGTLILSWPTPASAEADAVLTFWNHPIATFRAAVRSAAPAARVAAARQRLEALERDVRPEEVTQAPVEIDGVRGALVAVRERVLFGIMPGDLDPSAGETLEVVSQRATEQLRAALAVREEQLRPSALLAAGAIALVAAIGLALVLLAIRRAAVFARAHTGVATKRIVGSLQSRLLAYLAAVEGGMVTITAWALGVIAAYVWLAFVLRLFPYSRQWGDRLGIYLLSVLAELAGGILRALPGLFAVVVIFVATRVILRGVRELFSAVEKGAVTIQWIAADTAVATRRIIAVLIWIFALTVAYQYIPGSETDAFKAIGVFAGLMVSFGSAGLVSQLVSGLLVVYSRALRPGELVRAGDIVGVVSEVGLLSTKIVSNLREEITLPNATLSATTVTNYSRLAGSDGALLATAVKIGYDAPWRQVHALLMLAAERTRHVRKAPRPYVVQRELADSGVEYELRAHLERPQERFTVMSELHAHIQDAFNEFGVQIMTPSFESQPERSVVVPRSKWHVPPAAPATPSADAEAAA